MNLLLNRVNIENDIDRMQHLVDDQGSSNVWLKTLIRHQNQSTGITIIYKSAELDSNNLLKRNSFLFSRKSSADDFFDIAEQDLL